MIKTKPGTIVVKEYEIHSWVACDGCGAGVEPPEDILKEDERKWKCKTPDGWATCVEKTPDGEFARRAHYCENCWGPK